MRFASLSYAIGPLGLSLSCTCLLSMHLSQQLHLPTHTSPARHPPTPCINSIPAHPSPRTIARCTRRSTSPYTDVALPVLHLCLPKPILPPPPPGNPVERWGEYLERQGFSRYGQETMISGVTGQEMPCDIYIGPVYYQRLRHMVSDKFQVRSTGPINNLTRQPIKGRKFGGGIRFGEMERDSLLAHGAAYLLHDRLHACSDYHVADVCTRCVHVGWCVWVCGLVEVRVRG